ncbi:MAG TPA: hypothetical protein VMZ71_17915, partial [Gemmataceae bacterium]|nr:hypothetical protein [Gemmataceae bacterium]
TEAKDLSVFDAAHPRPKDDSAAPEVRAAMTKASDAQMGKLIPKDAATLAKFKRVVGTALRAMVSDELPKSIAVRTGPVESKLDGLTVHRAVLGRADEKDGMPVIGMFGPKFTGGMAVVWLHPSGKAAVHRDGKLDPAIRALTDAGFAIIAPDVLGVGENAFAKRTPVDKSYAGYTFGYNRALLAEQVHDALTAVAFGTTMLKVKALHVVGTGAMGVVAVLAKALAGDAVAKTAADLNQFRFENVKDTADPMMLPGAVKYGGLPAFLALCAPGEVLAHNHKGTTTGKISKAAYDAAGAPTKLTRVDEKLDDAKVVEWLLK